MGRWLMLVALLTNCTPEIPSSGELELVEESGALLDEVPQVPRFRLSGVQEISLESLVLVRGEVSSVSQGRIRRGDLPVSVEGRRVGLSARSDARDVVLVPTHVLAPGEEFSLVALGVGLLATFSVDSQISPILSRIGSGALSPGETAVYCHRDGQNLPEEFESLPSTRQPFAFGLDDSSEALPCFRIRVPFGEEFFVPPPRLGPWLVDPNPIFVREKDGSESSIESLHCVSPEEVIGAACFFSDGPALKMRLPRGHHVIVLQGSESVTHEILSLDAERDFSIGPLFPSDEYSLRLWSWRGDSLPRGTVEPTFAAFRSGAAGPHFVLTEVLADPRGPEPQSEWVEITNVGTAAGSLADYFFADGAGSVPLPDVTLGPGETGLVVRNDFQHEQDALPHSDARPLYVASLGGNGLRNSGERVELVGRDGEVVSSVPPLAASEGKTVCRRELWSSDDTPGFSISEVFGGTPGAPNEGCP